jgi:hypothetical protein
VYTRRNPHGGRHRVFEKTPKKTEVFFKFWDVDMSMFSDVLVCPLSMYATRMKLKPLSLLGVYAPRSRKIYCEPFDVRTFFHEASHHIVTLRMPHLYKTARGRAVEEAVADIAAAVSAMGLEVPRGAGWRLIQMGLALKHCRRLRFDEDGDPTLERRCILTALRAKPRLITRLF